VKPSTIRAFLAASCLLLAAPVMLTAVCVPAAAGPFEDGVTAYWQDDFDTALQLWRPLAEHGNAAAQYNLGIMYENGRGVKRDYAEALRWYRKAVDQNYADAQINLGTMYANGEGVEQDTDEALRWYRKAAEQGAAIAQNLLGVWHSSHPARTTQDFVEAHMWFSKAADQGHANAMFNLGSLYEEGLGVVRNFVQAYMWFEIAFSQGVKNSAKKRDAIAKNMTSAQIIEAQKLALKWLRELPDRARN